MDYKLIAHGTKSPYDHPKGCECGHHGEKTELETEFFVSYDDHILKFTFKGEVSLNKCDPLIQKAFTEKNYEVIDCPSELPECHHDDPVEIDLEDGDVVIEPMGDIKDVNHYSRNELDYYMIIQTFDSVPYSLGKLYGVVANDNLVEQLCLGKTMGSLREHLEESDQPFDSLTFIRQIAVGLKFLHSHDIVHGDINWDSIYLRTLDEPVICDFECAHDVGGKPGLSVAGDYLVGSSVWGGVHPGKDDVAGTVNDVYALGSVIWSIITRREPYSKMTFVQRQIAISEGKTEDLDEVSNPTLKDIISKCWEYCEIDPIIELLDKAIESSPKSS